ncbi:hypothetical protein F511_05417 [Dorcoceras hygrometricum]|uniref:Uncharacterized protein n=1 Tax=Dorcoceras hygrometricum TaxID=472368 RepID=A0A2Z7BFU8_9LAMI|nr:hypothetical protein F511_05417 [Dorcoceras hygrometricum]
MSSPSTTLVSSTAASIDSVPVSPETKEPWLPDQAELGSSQPPWYEEKSSNLRKRDPWKCDMSWRDNIYTFTPRTPERSPNMTSFLDAMREKSYNAPELIQKDLLCAFGFSRRGVELVGDLDERMGKAELVKAMQEEARASGEVGTPKKVARKRPAVSSAEEEARLEKRKKKGASTSGTRPGEFPNMTRVPTPPTRASEETSDLPPTITIPEASSPDRDLPVLKGAEDAEAVGHFAANLTSAMAWGGEVIRRLTRAHRTGKANRKKFDEAMGRHAEMVARLEELEVLRAQDEVVAATQRKELEAELAAEKEARAAEKRALRAELERANARAERVKEDFLKSPEFDSLLAKKAWGYFKDGFWGLFLSMSRVVPTMS